MITSVKLPDELHQKAMRKAANENIFGFSELIRILLDEYTSTEEASLRKVEK